MITPTIAIIVRQGMVQEVVSSGKIPFFYRVIDQDETNDDHYNDFKVDHVGVNMEKFTQEKI